MNIGSKSGWPASVLSNFAHTPFEIDGVSCESAEGFIQALKFRDPAMQEHVCGLIGLKAKRATNRRKNKRIAQNGIVWWEGREIKFRSKEHFALVERALRAKFTQNSRARRVILATNGAVFTHTMGHNESPFTSLPAREFVRMLHKIRDELQEGQ